MTLFVTKLILLIWLIISQSLVNDTGEEGALKERRRKLGEVDVISSDLLRLITVGGVVVDFTETGVTGMLLSDFFDVRLDCLKLVVSSLSEKPES